ncbi:ATP-dependent DNA helicase [Trichonephila clavipes]|uniref:ATP-dependent DNA helicase n=1 Tax=Trichonephila clavipes TaxID=2585209 RepID=A0A8X7BFC3_TRICX|nr:ATP-dependent DNA helicase [Trichonephila clavipes]
MAGKHFRYALPVIRLRNERKVGIYTDNDGYCQSCKAAVGISATTVHTNLKISLSRFFPLPSETAQQYKTLFKYIKVIIIDEIRYFSQLPLVHSAPIYKQPKQTIAGPILWQNLKFYELNEVMRQANQQFSSILKKIGNGEHLDEMEITLIESRFCTVEEAKASRCRPQGPPQARGSAATRRDMDSINVLISARGNWHHESCRAVHKSVGVRGVGDPL